MIWASDEVYGLFEILLLSDIQGEHSSLKVY
jgi:hypothetical protein